MGAQLSVPMEKNGVPSVSILDRKSLVIKGHGDGALNHI